MLSDNELALELGLEKINFSASNRALLDKEREILSTAGANEAHDPVSIQRLSEKLDLPRYA